MNENRSRVCDNARDMYHHQTTCVYTREDQKPPRKRKRLSIASAVCHKGPISLYQKNKTNSMTLPGSVGTIVAPQ